MGTVYILTKDDGNVCCPSFEIVAVYEHKADAEKMAAWHNDRANKFPYKDVNHSVLAFNVKRLR